MMADVVDEERGLRITTWNVNGIRNPFSYQPWRQQRTFAGMFMILEADIVVMQETKIQRKDLVDDMVLVPGWDVYFSLPKHKKGYSGVAIYTRNAVCAPIRAEEGITGVLTPPNSSTSFFDLPKDQQIGGYPTPIQMSQCALDQATLDAEGRCVILEFPAFVLIGTYCPATRDESRDEFRIGFQDALDARVRNLVAMGKRVFLTGDLNIMLTENDSANMEEALRKKGLTAEEYFSMPSRKMLNQMLVNGKVYGEREEGRERPIMWDLCRGFHPTRKGMYTCWETKINARPGNFGSRIDYVLCSEDWKDWFGDANIQEGLMGSDHCPVYATLKQKVEIEGMQVDIRDMMSDGLFRDGKRVRDWATTDLLPMSAKLIPEFDRRQNIRDMFKRKPSLMSEQSQSFSLDTERAQSSLKTVPELLPAASIGEGFSVNNTNTAFEQSQLPENISQTPSPLRKVSTTPVRPPAKRSADVTSTASKRAKSSSKPVKGQPPKGQSSLKGFFKPKATQAEVETQGLPVLSSIKATQQPTPNSPTPSTTDAGSDRGSNSPTKATTLEKPFIDPIVAKESWSKLLSKRVVPRCEHNESCVSFLTKKPGINLGRSFYMCPRPLGPSGAKEKNTQWRCGTFIWSSDWTGNGSDNT